jgi:hypothetical protein
VTADSSGNLIVKMDGVQVLNTPVSLPTNAWSASPARLVAPPTSTR